MERAPLTADSQALVDHNLLETYARLGRAVPGATIEEKPEYLLCSGEFGHPVCNFAARLRLGPGTANELASIASQRLSFHLYRLPTDEPQNIDIFLSAAGFEDRHMLKQMVGSNCEGAEADIEWATTAATRLEVAEFMIRQFFAKKSADFRERLALTVALAHDLELVSLREGAGFVAAAMLCASERMLGFYNVCVSAPMRGRGVGTKLVNRLIHEANQRNLTPTLQCELQLAPWYKSLGFTECGEVRVLALGDSV